MDGSELLAIRAATRFEHTKSGRLRHENSPDRSPAPRLWIGGSEDARIVSIAFAARSSAVGAEVGVATLPRFRGRGFAAAVTAAWAALPSLAGRVLFYSADVANVSSLRVAERLGLHFVGADVAIR